LGASHQETLSFVNWKKNFRNVIVGVCLPQTISFSIYHWGLYLSSPVNCALLWLSVTPVTAFLGMLFNREKRSWIKAVGVMFAIGGALITMDLGNYSSEKASVIGDLLVIASTIFYACYLLFTKELSEGMGTWTLSSWFFGGISFWSALALPPLWLTVGMTDKPYVPDSGWVALILAVLVGTTLPYVLNNWVILNTSSLIIAMYTPVEMILTALLASFVLGESLKWQQGVGSLFIIMGLAIVTFAKYRESLPAKVIEEIEIPVEDLMYEHTELKLTKHDLYGSSLRLDN